MHIDLDSTINSGQVFLWKKYDKCWYGVDGQDIIKINEDLHIESYSRKEPDIFRNNDDYRKILKAIRKDSVVREAEKRYPSLRIIRQDPFQCLISFIVSSNSNIQKIKLNLQNLCKKFGKRVVFDGIEFYTFPTPESLADAKLNEIKLCGIGYRSRFVKDASKMVSLKKISFEELKNYNYFEAKESLKRVSGVGNKVADCVLLFSLEKTEAFPLDRWMLRILQKYYSKRFQLSTRILTDKQYDILHKKIVNYFGTFAGYAQQLLFKMERENFGKNW